MWHLYVIRHDDRDALQKKLLDKGIGTQIHYPIPPYKSEAYRDEVSDIFPESDRFSDTCLSLPMGLHLEDAQLQYVIDEVLNVV